MTGLFSEAIYHVGRPIEMEGHKVPCLDHIKSATKVRGPVVDGRVAMVTQHVMGYIDTLRSMAQRKKISTQSHIEPSPEPKRPTTDNPLVFISHDSRDADLADAFGNLLTDASGGILKSFRSSDRKGNAGIEYGQEWYRAIMQKLDDATDVVALLTAQSINRP